MTEPRKRRRNIWWGPTTSRTGDEPRGREKNMSWTDERVEALKKLWAEGLSASQIAKQLSGVTRNAVIGKVHRLGLSGRATPSRPPSRIVRAARPRAAFRPTLRLTTHIAPPPMPIPVEPQALPNGSFATVLDLS